MDDQDLDSDDTRSEISLDDAEDIPSQYFEQLMSKFRCRKSLHNGEYIKWVCKVADCRDKLLCKRCIKTDHATLQLFIQPLDQFIRGKSKQKVLEKDVFSQTIKQFVDNQKEFYLDLNESHDVCAQEIRDEFKKIKRKIWKEIEVIERGMLNVLEEQRDNVWTQVIIIEKLLKETFFDIQSHVRKAFNTHDYEKFNDLVRKLASAPNAEKLREIKERYSGITGLI